MENPLIDTSEKERLESLYRHEILDTLPEREYDDITWLTAKACDVPIAAISFFDGDRVWLKSKVGMDISEIARGDSLCEYALMDREDLVVVPDASVDPRFANNPQVAGGLGIKFYASALLITSENHVLGALTIADTKPRDYAKMPNDILRAFANQIMQTLELRCKSIELERANVELRNLSLRDELTGFYNRRGLQAIADQYLMQLRTRETEAGAWVMLADMDGLKKINDRHGHLEGSAAIVTASRLLASCVRGSDVLSRIGGDEFVAFMINTQHTPVSSVMKRIQDAFDHHNSTAKKPYRLSVSVGIAKTDHADTRSLAELIKAADEDMYKAKQNNRLKSIPGFESTHIHRSVDPIMVSDPFMISSEKLHISTDPRHVS